MYGFLFFFFPAIVFSLNKDKPEDAFQKDCLDAHNAYRAEHGVPPLVWSTRLTEHAQRWADELASRDEIRHDDDGLAQNNEGENLAFFRPAVPKCQDSMVGNCILCREMVKRWYDEVKFYNFDNGAGVNPDSITKHFTQIVWFNTSEVGIGTAISKTYGFVTVARYWPQGNKGGPELFILNVPPEGGPLPSVSLQQSPKSQPKTAASSTPTGYGLPLTAKSKKQKDGQPKAPISASTVTPKPEQPASDTNTTEQNPHQMVQNDDIGNTFDSHLSKDFGYEGAKMYGDGSMEDNVQANMPQVKSFNSHQENDVSNKVSEQLNDMEANGNEKQVKKITGVGKALERNEGSEQDNMGVKGSGKKVEKMNRVGEALVGNFQEKGWNHLDNVETSGAEKQVGKTSGVGEALVGNSQEEGQNQLDNENGEQPGKLRGVGKALVGSAQGDGQDQLDNMEVRGNNEQSGEINADGKLDGAQGSVKISDVGKALLRNAQNTEQGSAEQVNNSKQSVQLSLTDSPKNAEMVSDTHTRIVQSGEPLLQGNVQNISNQTQQLSSRSSQDLQNGKDISNSKQDEVNKYMLEENGNVAVSAGLNNYDDSMESEGGNMVDFGTGSIFSIPDREVIHNNAQTNKNGGFYNHNDPNNNGIINQKNGNRINKGLNNQNLANDNARNNGMPFQKNGYLIKNGIRNQNGANKNGGNNGNSMQNGFNNRNGAFDNRNNGIAMQKNGKNNVNQFGGNNQQGLYGNGKIIGNNGKNNNMKNNANLHGWQNKPNRFNGNGNMQNNGNHNNMRNDMNNNGNIRNNQMNNQMNNGNLIYGGPRQSRLRNKNEQKFNMNNNNARNQQNNLVNIGKNNAVMNSNQNGLINNPGNFNRPLNSKDESNAMAIPEALKNRGLVRTVKGPDGSSAQVFLTKNGAHAGLVFRDYISRGETRPLSYGPLYVGDDNVAPSSRVTTKQSSSKRIIYVV